MHTASSSVRGTSSVYRSILITYLVVFLVPYVIGLAGNAYFENKIESEMVASWDYSLHQMQLVIDAELRSAQRADLSLAANAAVQELMTEPWFTAQDKLQAVTLKSEMAAACGGVDHARDIIICFRSSQCLLTTTGRYPRETMHVYAETLGMTQTKLLDSLSGQGTMSTRVVEGERGKFIFLLYNIYNYNYKSILATVATVISWEGISSRAAFLENGNVYWMNKDGSTIVLSGQEDGKTLNWDVLMNGDGKHPLEANGKMYLSRPSELGSHAYVISVSKNQFYARSSSMRLVGIFQMVAALAAGLLTAFLSTRRSYRPIQRMIELMHENRSLDQRDTETFDKLEASLHALLSENKDLSMLKEEHEERVRNSQWAAMIRGFDYGSSSRMKTMGSSPASYFLAQPWMLILLEMDHPENSAFLQNAANEAEKAWNVMLLALKNTIHETLLKGTDGVICLFEDSIAVIYPLAEGEEDTLDMENRLSYALQFTPHAMNLRLFASVSRRHSKEEEVHTAYREAQQVSSYRQFWGRSGEGILFFDGRSEELSSAGGWQDDLTQLRLLIRERNWDKAKALQRDMLEKYMSKDIHAMDSNRACVSSLALLLIHETPETEPNKSENEALLRKLMHADGMETFRMILDQLFDHLQKQTEIQIQDAVPAWMEDLKTYVEAHYQDPNLSTSALAEHFDLSLSYIGRTFKKFTGIGLLEYIHGVRIRHCRELLESGMSVRETAEKTGYIDSKAMIRVFKKIVGITPGQYRSDYSGNSDTNS